MTKFNLSIKAKTIIGVAIIEFFFLLVLVIYSRTILVENLDSNIDTTVKNVSVLLKSALSDAVISRDLATIEAVINEVNDLNHLAYVKVVADSNTLAQIGDTSLLNQERELDENINSVDDDIYDVKSQIRIGDQVFATIYLGMPTRHKVEIIANATRNLTIIAVIELVLVAVFSLLLGIALTRRLSLLKSSAERISKGEIGFQLPIKGKDEVSLVIQSFNHMSKTLMLNSQALASRNARLNAIMNGVNDIILLINEDGTILSSNAAVETIFGISSATVEGEQVNHYIRWQKESQRHDNNTLDFNSLIHSQGDRVVYGTDSSGSPIRLELHLSKLELESEDNYYVMVLRDVTYINDIEYKLKESLAEITSLVDTFNAPILLFSLDVTGKVLTWNDYSAECLGLTSEEVIGKKITTLFDLSKNIHLRDFMKTVQDVHLNQDPVLNYELRIDSDLIGTQVFLLNLSYRFNHDDNKSNVICLGQKITELDAYRTKMSELVHKNMQERDAVLTLNTDGIVIVAADNTVRYFNDSFVYVTGIRSESLILGKSIEQIKNEIIENSEHTDELADQLFSHAEHEFIIKIKRPREVVLRYRSALAYVGESYSTVYYFRDITHETAVDKIKSEFLSTAAHELRTPLANIMGFSELLSLREYPADKTKELASTVHRHSNHLKNLLDDLLDIARIEAGAFHSVDMKKSDIKGLLSQLIEDTCLNSELHTVQMNCCDEWPIIEYDETKIKQALLNVLNNAIKYSPEGGEISITTSQGMQENRPVFIVEIEDNGIGMTTEEVSHAGERFYRADKSGKLPGTGLGLALSKEIMELHKGQLEIASAYQKGTKVTFIFPIASIN